jgi:hypothetical protein
MESESLNTLRKLRATLMARIVELRAAIAPLQTELDIVDRAIRAIEGALIPATGLASSRAAVAHHARKANPDTRELTMKQMVIRALLEHLTNGATVNQLLEFFATHWGRDDVMRTSLSPQLTRLKRDGKIELRGKVWHIASATEFDWVDYTPLNENEPLSE